MHPVSKEPVFSNPKSSRFSASCRLHSARLLLPPQIKRFSNPFLSLKTCYSLCIPRETLQSLSRLLIKTGATTSESHGSSCQWYAYFSCFQSHHLVRESDFPILYIGHSFPIFSDKSPLSQALLPLIPQVTSSTNPFTWFYLSWRQSDEIDEHYTALSQQAQ